MCPHGYHHSGSMATPALGTRDVRFQRITMCPHGYHHSGSMATPALGTRDVRFYIYIYIYIYIFHVFTCNFELKWLLLWTFTSVLSVMQSHYK